MGTNVNETVKLRNVRIAFANIFTARKVNESDPGEPSFSASFLMDKNTDEGKANIEAVKAAMNAAFKKQWSDNPPKLKPNQVCLRDGDDESYAGFAGNMYVSARTRRRPTVVDRDRTPLTESDDKIYSGCIVNAVLRVWPQDNNFGKRINCSLEAVQYVAPGERFGAKSVDVTSEFEDLTGNAGGNSDSPF